MNHMRPTAMLLIAAIAFASFAVGQQSDVKQGAPRTEARVHRSVTGPRTTMNEAIAAGATAVVTLQPVQPKTVPASSYPPGTVIMNQTIFLGSVPARVWIEGQITNWAPEELKIFQVRIDASDLDGDGGGYDGDNADCGGEPTVGAGDLFPAIQPCTANADCRATMSGITSPCGSGEPSRCVARPPFFPPGGNVCEFGFFDKCDPRYVGLDLSHIASFDSSSIDSRFGWGFDPPDAALDFHPSYSGTLVLDVPANAKGKYVIDVRENESFMQNFASPPNNNIPIAQVNLAVIQVISCSTDLDCQDNDACTVDVCQGGCCTHDPVAGWNQATECCHPMTGVQSPIPQSTSCRIGGCSFGGSSGSPILIPLTDGTACVSGDPCYLPGQCQADQCAAQQYAGPDCPKPRFISFDITTGSTPSAYRVRLVSLHHPNPPYTGGDAADFSAFEGEYRWVGEPATYVESGANPAPVYAAFVGCNPHYRNWSAIDLLHVTGAEIVPSSVFDVQSIAEGLDINVESNYSDPTTITTSRWADVIIPYSPPNTGAQPNAGDHAALAEKFRGGSNAITKPRALLVGMDAAGIPNLGSDVSFSEISAAVDAYRGRPYPFTGPTPCP